MPVHDGGVVVRRVGLPAGPPAKASSTLVVTAVVNAGGGRPADALQTC